MPFFAPGDATGSIYTLVTEKHITELGLANCNSALYPIDTVFLTARGTVGKVAMAGRPMAMNQSCFAFVGINVPQTVVYQVIKGAVRSLKAKANGATFAAINTRDLKVEEVLLPSSTSMSVYNDWALPIHVMMRVNDEESLRLATLRDALLPKLMSGEIDVSKVDISQLNNHLPYSNQTGPALAGPVDHPICLSLVLTSCLPAGESWFPGRTRSPAWLRARWRCTGGACSGRCCRSSQPAHQG